MVRCRRLSSVCFLSQGQFSRSSSLMVSNRSKALSFASRFWSGADSGFFMRKLKSFEFEIASLRSVPILETQIGAGSLKLQLLPVILLDQIRLQTRNLRTTIVR